MNAVIVQLTYYSGGNVDVTPDQVYTLSDRDIWVLRFGSKLEFASWYTYPGVICQCHRLTQPHLRHHELTSKRHQGPSSSRSSSSTPA